MRPVKVIQYQPRWPAEFETIADRLSFALDRLAIAIDHVGSTSVPGLPAKDMIDVQVMVETLDRPVIIGRFDMMGFRCRPEPWNNEETSFGTKCEKLVFAPPIGGRACNVHVRVEGEPNARFALLFRDYLRANEDVRIVWGEFKTRVSVEVPDLARYGQIKAPATEILMEAATGWAIATGWV